MCGRFTIISPPEAMRHLFGYEGQPNFPPRYNIAPTQPVPIIRVGANGAREFVLVRWGLVPSWSKEMPTTPLFNARADTINDKPSFRGAFRHHRALMPADGFYEWRVLSGGAKQPYFIRRRDRTPFAMAAIWDNWMPANGSELESCAVVTTEANETLTPIHHRMPVILDPKDYVVWLDPTTPLKELEALLVATPDDAMEAIPVSPDVNRVANDNPALLDPYLAPPLPVAAKKKEKTTDDRQQDLF